MIKALFQGPALIGCQNVFDQVPLVLYMCLCMSVNDKEGCIVINKAFVKMELKYRRNNLYTGTGKQYILLVLSLLVALHLKKGKNNN